MVRGAVEFSKASPRPSTTSTQT